MIRVLEADKRNRNNLFGIELWHVSDELFNGSCSTQSRQSFLTKTYKEFIDEEKEL